MQNVIRAENVTANSFYPVFEKVEVQRAGGDDWEAALVCAIAREGHVLPYQVILLRHAGFSGTAFDVSECRVRFDHRHVALAAQEELVAGMPVGVTEPKGWAQLLQASETVEWQASDKKEECALIDVKKAILPVETVPAGAKVMRMAAVYRAKLDSAGVLIERKSRWVVCGNGQQHGVHYEDVYAPCTQLSTLRILIQLSLVLGLLAFSLDVITCFLNGELDVEEPMYVRWPSGRTVRGVLFGKVQKSVYGLKQAPRIWYKTSKEFLLAYDHRLRVSNIDPCLFYIWQPGTLVVFINVHVDDYSVFTSSVEWKVHFFQVFAEKWPSKDKGELVELLGMSFAYRDFGLVRECSISQVGLIMRMLERYGMKDCNPSLTSMEPRLSLLPVESERTEQFPYVNLVMELMWLARCSRPDILTAVCYLARRPQRGTDGTFLVSVWEGYITDPRYAMVKSLPEVFKASNSTRVRSFVSFCISGRARGFLAMMLPATDDVLAWWIVFMVTDRKVIPSTAKKYTSGLWAEVEHPLQADDACRFEELLRMAVVVNPNSFLEIVVFAAMLTAFFFFFRKDNVSAEKADAWNPRGHLVRSDVTFL
eukprot:gene34209-biopygen20511